MYCNSPSKSLLFIIESVIFRFCLWNGCCGWIILVVNVLNKIIWARLLAETKYQKCSKYFTSLISLKLNKLSSCGNTKAMAMQWLHFVSTLLLRKNLFYVPCSSTTHFCLYLIRQKDLNYRLTTCL